MSGITAGTVRLVCEDSLGNWRSRIHEDRVLEYRSAAIRRYRGARNDHQCSIIRRGSAFRQSRVLCAVSLWPPETYLPGPAVSVTQPNGMVIMPNVQPGDYLLAVFPVFLKTHTSGAARSGTRDVLEQFVNVQYDSSAPLDIQLAFDGGQITGTVTNSAATALEGATLTLVPDVTRRHRPDQYRVAISGADGRFSMGGIPPGEYKAFALGIH